MVVMMAGIHISHEIFAIDVLTALGSSLEQRRKDALRLLQLYGDQAKMCWSEVDLVLRFKRAPHRNHYH